jgi:hypothetical protein
MMTASSNKRRWLTNVDNDGCSNSVVKISALREIGNETKMERRDAEQDPSFMLPAILVSPALTFSESPELSH